MSFTEQSQKLVAEIRSTVEQGLEGLRTELRQRFEDALEHVTISLPDSLISEEQLAEVVQPAVEAALAERPPAPEPAPDATALRDALGTVDGARSQADVLRALTDESTRFASRCAVFLVRGATVRGWGGRGFDVDWSDLKVDPSQAGPWQRLTEGAGAQVLSSAQRADLASRLDSPVAAEAVLIPLVLRDRVAAALYADRVGDDPFDASALQTLAYVGALAIETLPLRERPSTSTLTLEAPPEPAEAAPPAAEPPPEPVVEEAVPEVEPEPETEPEVEVEFEDEGTDFAISEDTDLGATDLGEVDLEVEEEPVPAQEPAAAPVEAETAGWQVEEEEPDLPAVEPEAEPEPVESAPEPAAAPPPPPTAETPAVEAAPADTEPRAGSGSAAVGKTPQVEPPEDVQGPGWAFGSTPQQDMDDEEEARHEEARRLARLLISEIKLYNEDQVQEGRKNNDVVERLKDDIDRSRQLYEERVDPRVRDKTDYFYQEMVRLLGAGDPKTLGI